MKENFFIKRPVFATVISIVITLVGIVAIKALPIEQYPDLTPPQVQVQATYNGASAEVLAQSVASLLETQINGVDNMIYMNSVSSGSGRMTLTVTFAIGTDPDQATINVNNRVQLAMAQLPQEVQRMGITVVKSSPSILMLVFLTSPNGRYDTVYLSNYALLNVVDELKLIPGVGNAQNFASQNYAIRVWLDPLKMSTYKITASNISQAIQNQNAQFAAGKIGSEPMSSDIGVTWQIITQGRLTTPEEFGNIIIRTDSDGSILRLRDVARVELGAESYDFIGRQNGKDAVPIGIYLAPGANALSTASAVKEAMEKLAQDFPDGLSYNIPYDTTTFINISINEVVKTLIEAMILVFIVVFVFLQNWRATLIPCLAVPVSIVGTFAGMYVLGFSINTLTMFGLVLAIGMVVDDAIVVLENVERHIDEGFEPRQAAIKAMQEVTRPIIAIVLVLCSVFIPVAFTGGIAGKMYQQFAITIAISVVISGIVALSFTPALCAYILKPSAKGPALPFRIFNKLFGYITQGYMSSVIFLMKRSVIGILLFAALSAATYFIFIKIPSSLVPNEDQGYALGLIVLPDGASLSRTSEAVSYMDNITMKDDTVENVISFTGMDILSGSLKTNYGSVFITLKPWNQRKGEDKSSFALVNKYFEFGSSMPQGMAMAFNPPPIMGMSTTGGFEMYIQNRAGDDNSKMYNVIREFEVAANQRPELSGVSSTFSITSPQLYAVL
ncbi:MAG: efflux RND transporter permease subunit, partial [Deferribacterales bacterium]|nr:efflux RND transporter permease subunit [Deferribacterales bacterium]